MSVEGKVGCGLVLINKPSGPTSSTVAVWVREILATKAGHCGTLDPNVSGVLPILLGRGIKLLEYLQKHDKEYVCLMRTEKPVPEEKVREVLNQFVGKIYQKPPEHAAVARNIRVRRIYAIELLETRDGLILFRVTCQHGTYVRKLVEDVGALLGMKTEMARLRRTKVFPFTEEQCVDLTKLKDAAELSKAGKPEMLDKLLLPIEDAIKNFPKVCVKDSAVPALCAGADLMAPGFSRAEGHMDKKDDVCLMTQKGELIGMGKALFSKADMERQKKGPVVDLEKVVMEHGKYGEWKGKTAGHNK
jgi:H/ACA ribonucleoprotein complex subunit 4